jgi:hypothetical protein
MSMRDLQELYFMRQFLGDAQGWLQVAFLLCLFAVLLLKPEKIRSAGQFRLAWLFLVLSIVVPQLMMLGLGFLSVTGSYSYRSSDAVSLLTALQAGSGPLLFGVALLFAFMALSPGWQSRRREAPVKHPLE